MLFSAQRTSRASTAIRRLGFQQHGSTVHDARDMSMLAGTPPSPQRSLRSSAQPRTTRRRWASRCSRGSVRWRQIMLPWGSSTWSACPPPPWCAPGGGHLRYRRQRHRACVCQGQGRPMRPISPAVRTDGHQLCLSLTLLSPSISPPTGVTHQLI